MSTGELVKNFFGLTFLEQRAYPAGFYFSTRLGLLVSSQRRVASDCYLDCSTRKCSAKLVSVLESPTLNFSSGARVKSTPDQGLGHVGPSRVSRTNCALLISPIGILMNTPGTSNLFLLLTASSEPTPTLESSYNRLDHPESRHHHRNEAVLEEENNRLFIDALWPARRTYPRRSHRADHPHGEPRLSLWR